MRRRGEQGYVMIAVMLVMGIALILGGVAVTGTVRSRSGSVKDMRAKRAQQAADAGLSTAIYRLNQLNLSQVNFSGGLSGLSQSLACQPLLAFGTSVNVGFADINASTGQCGSGKPAVPAGSIVDEDAGDGTHMQAWVTAGGKAIGSSVLSLAPSRLSPIVVAVGTDDAGTPTDTSDDVVRRVRARLNPVAPFQALEAASDPAASAPTPAVPGNIAFTGTSTVLNGAAEANGDISLPLVFVNTNLSVLPLNVTGAVSAAGSITGAVALTTKNITTEAPVARPPVTIAATKSDCPAAGCPGGAYSAVTHYLTASTGTVTLNGGDYVFCGVSITGTATLRPVPTAGKPVRIFIDHPKSARCLVNAADTIKNGMATITGRIDPGVSVQPSQLQIYMVGPPAGILANAPRTKATFDTRSSALNLLPGFFFYGPTSDVSLTYTTFTGNLIGHDLTVAAKNTLGLAIAGVFTQDLNVNNLPLNSQLGVFSVAEYGECSAVSVTAATSANDC